jgi:hypothetical protein
MNRKRIEGDGMRNYQMHLIVDEFASQFFGRERVFFQLFTEYENAFGEYKNLLEKQIHFITKPIQKLKIKKNLTEVFHAAHFFSIKNGIFEIDITNRSFAQLEIYENFIILKSSGNYEAETYFFEVLRKCESTFIAVDRERQRCVWLKPIKERKFV